MSNNIDPSQRSSFFPNSKTAPEAAVNKGQTAALNPAVMKRNDYGRVKELNSLSSTDAKVQITDAIKDFSRIKKAVDAAPEIDNSAKIANLRSQIQAGTYKVDYDALADKLLSSEF